MIVYRELSSLESDLGYSAKQLYALSNTARSHYRTVRIPKGNGEYRRLSVPDEELKAVQRRIASVLLGLPEISPYATAYRIGGSPLRNALPHIGHPRVLKVDIRHFFDRVTVAQVKEYGFPSQIYSEPNRVLLTALCCCGDSLPQGAPTSPALSNLILREFDDRVGGWCESRGIAYTRYCDDMTFSGDFDPMEVKRYAARELRKYGFYLNRQKTVSLRDGQKMAVTGIVVNRKPAVSSAYKRKIRQEMYYCARFGIGEHLKARGIRETEADYARKLLGRINYVLSVEPENAEFREYRRRFAAKE